jgi:aspartyl-tRNA(Asn)/glutamyl-tRNA(Gln) amidotransferase subunit C
MSGISRDDVVHVARLSALEVPEAELDHLVTQLQSIVAMVEQLNEVTVAGKAPPFNAAPAQAELRPDVVAPQPLAHAPAAFAPGFSGGFFAVPRHTAMEEG